MCGNVTRAIEGLARSGRRALGTATLVTMRATISVRRFARLLLLGSLGAVVILGVLLVVLALAVASRNRAMDDCVNHPPPGRGGIAIELHETSRLPPRFECVEIDGLGRVVSTWKPH